MAARPRLAWAALGFGLAALASSWNPAAAPFGLAVGLAAAVLAVRADTLVEDVTLFDVYRGPPIPDGRKNLAMAIRYRAVDRTLTDADADAAHGRIVERLRREVGAELRG